MSADERILSKVIRRCLVHKLSELVSISTNILDGVDSSKDLLLEAFDDVVDLLDDALVLRLSERIADLVDIATCDL